MKVLFLTLLVVAGAFGRSAVQQEKLMAEGPACPIDDPLHVPGPVPLNVTLDPLANLKEGSDLHTLVAEGLSTLRYEIEINIILLTAWFEVDIPKVDGNATYTAEGYVDARPLRHETVPSGNFTGNGLGVVKGTNIKVRGNASIFLTITGRVQLSRLVLSEVSFASITLHLGANFSIGGGAIDWEEFNRNIKQNFDQDWAQHNTAIADKIRLAANNYLRNYTLQELIDLIGGGGGGGDDGEC